MGHPQGVVGAVARGVDEYNGMRYSVTMIQSFADAGTEDVFNAEDTRAARKTCPRTLWPVAQRKLTQLNAVRELALLAVPPGNRLEALKGSRRGQHSIRINDQYRICFRWSRGDAYEVSIVDYH